MYTSYLFKINSRDFNDLDAIDRTSSFVVAQEDEIATRQETARYGLQGEILNLNLKDIFVHTCEPEAAITALANALYHSGKERLEDEGPGAWFSSLSVEDQVQEHTLAWKFFGLFFAYSNLQLWSWSKYRRVVEFHQGDSLRAAQNPGFIAAWRQAGYNCCYTRLGRSEQPRSFTFGSVGAIGEDPSPEQIRAGSSHHRYWLSERGLFEGPALEANPGAGVGWLSTGVPGETRWTLPMAGRVMPAAAVSSWEMFFVPPHEWYWKLLFGRQRGLFPGGASADVLAPEERLSDVAVRRRGEFCSLAEYLAKAGPSRMIREVRIDTVLNNLSLFQRDGSPLSETVLGEERLATMARQYTREQQAAHEQLGTIRNTALGVAAGVTAIPGPGPIIGAAVGAGSVIAEIVAKVILPRPGEGVEAVKPVDAFGNYVVPLQEGSVQRYRTPRVFRAKDGDATSFIAFRSVELREGYASRAALPREIKLFQPLVGPRIECFENLAREGDARARYVMSLFEDAPYIRRRDRRPATDRTAPGELCPVDRPFFYRYTDGTRDDCYADVSVPCARIGHVAMPSAEGKFLCSCPPERPVSVRYAPSPDFPGEYAARACLREGESPCGERRQTTLGEGRVQCTLSEEARTAELAREMRGLTPAAWRALHGGCNATGEEARRPTATELPGFLGPVLFFPPAGKAEKAPQGGATKVAFNPSFVLGPVLPQDPERQAQDAQRVARTRCPLTGLLVLQVSGADSATVQVGASNPTTVAGRAEVVLAPGTYPLLVSSGERRITGSAQITANTLTEVTLTLPAPASPPPEEAPPGGQEGAPSEEAPGERPSGRWRWVAGGVAATLSVGLAALAVRHYVLRPRALPGPGLTTRETSATESASAPKEPHAAP